MALPGRAVTLPRLRPSAADVLLAAACLALLTAAAWPRVARSRVERRAAEAVEAVQAVEAAALAARRERGTWPPAAPRGVVPSELAGRLPAGTGFDRGSFDLSWALWMAVTPQDPVALELPPEEEEGPPPGGIPRELRGLDTLPIPGEAAGAEGAAAGPAGILARFGAAASLVQDSLPPAGPHLAELGAVTVQARDERILAALLDRFGTARSFVRGDLWVYLLPPEAP